MPTFTDLAQAFHNTPGNPYKGKIFIAHEGQLNASWIGREAFARPEPPATEGPADASLSLTGGHFNLLPPIPMTFPELLAAANLPSTTDGLIIVMMDNPLDQPHQARRVYVLYTLKVPDTRTILQKLTFARKPVLTHVQARTLQGAAGQPYGEFIQGNKLSKPFDKTIAWVPPRANEGYVPVAITDLAALLARIARAG